MPSIRLSCTTLALLAACGGDGGLTGEVPAQCNPLGGAGCVTPWPSSLYQVADASTATGVRLDIPEDALPANLDDIVVSGTQYNWRDGFSPAGAMIIAFPGGVDDGNLVHYSDYAASLTDASPTVVIDMSTGERVLHFAELNLRAADKPDRQALYIRPAARLKGATRYAVGIRKSLKAADGTDLPISPGFAALLSGETTNHPLLERARPGYDAVFAAFEAEGIPRDDLVVAWDFTTQSDEQLRSDMLLARDQAVDAIGDAGADLTYDVDVMRDHDDADWRWHIEGTYDAPLFLTQDGAFNPAVTLARDPDTRAPVYQGHMYRVPFVAIVPECAYLAENRPVGVMIYGHGLLGSADQVDNGSQRGAGRESCRIIIGTDLRGMSAQDLPNVAQALNDMNKGPEFFDVIVQGLINTIALENIVRGPMAETLFVDDSDVSLVDPTDVVYYGLSQGGIFGSSFLAWDPFITRGVVGVGAANYSEMLERSSDWPTYEVILTGAYEDPLETSILLYLVQMGFDDTEPSSTVNVIMDPGAIPDTPAKQILMQIAVGDRQVPNVASEYQARSMPVPVLVPASPYTPFGLDEAADGAPSALVIFDGGAGDTINPGNLPPEDVGDDPHTLPRNQPAAWRQMRIFWDTGEVVNTCGGDGSQPCLCYMGYCD
ncbi:MAG TPA: hypothetical protein VL172_22165 [Kofleriaceae bacterium]|nr:hypothetical protein [Kofleriaceae bacterium]